jgi:hypothetical protein
MAWQGGTSTSGGSVPSGPAGGDLTGTYPNPSLEHSLKALASTGLHDGGTLSINADTTKFDVAAGTGAHVDTTTDVENPVVTEVTFGPFVAVTPTFLATHPVTYIMVDSAGALVQLSAQPTPSQRRDNIALGVVVHSDNAVVNLVNNLPALATSTHASLFDFAEAVGLFNGEGNAVSPNGSNLAIDKSSGRLFSMGAAFTANPKAPNRLTIPAAAAATFRYRNQDGTEDGDVALIDPTTYDNGGVTTAVPGANNATIQRIYIFPSGALRVQRGQTVYSHLSDAIDAIGSGSPIVETNIKENGLLLAAVALKKGTVNLSDTDDCRFFQASRMGDLLGAGSSAVGTMQDAYDNSVVPQITTDATRGALTVQRGSAADTDSVVTVRNGAGGVVYTVDAVGNVTVSKSSDAGLIIDPDSPDYGWRDLKGEIIERWQRGESAGYIELALLVTRSAVIGTVYRARLQGLALRTRDVEPTTRLPHRNRFTVAR